jgi:hypothetical protein
LLLGVVLFEMFLCLFVCFCFFFVVVRKVVRGHFSAVTRLTVVPQISVCRSR